MKKFSLQFLFILLAGSLASYAQTIVGTTPENKNVVLEEFTGIYCGYCPQGHAIAQNIYDQHPNDVVLINIHTGSFANPSGSDPDYRTQWGSAIAGQASVGGYPAGTVNRHLFPGWEQAGGTAMSRGQWTAASNQMLAAESYLNVGCVATMTSDGFVSIDVEVYYTGDSPESTNLLNIAVLQNNILGPQSGGGAGNNYNHMHMLRDLVTGQWGVEISETTEGSLYSNTFEYQIPEHYNDIPTVLEDIDIVAFVTETHQEVVSGIKGTIITEAIYDYDPAISHLNFPYEEACGGAIKPRVEITNHGGLNLTSLDFEYSVNGGDTYSYTWEGDLVYTASELVVLPEIPYNSEGSNEIIINISNPNNNDDENDENNSSSSEFEVAVETTTNIEMQLNAGLNGNQISWEFYNSDGEIIASGGGYATNEVVNMELPVDESGCYDFYLFDSGGDGFTGSGYLKLYNDGLVFKYITDELEDVMDIAFHANNALAAPADFNATNNDYEVTFEWTAPAKADLEGYHIYEASDMNTPINDALITETSYVYTLASNGAYEYYLVAVYDEGMSDPVGPVFVDLNVGLTDLSKATFNIYPNPIKDQAQLQLNLQYDSQVSWSIVSLTGKVVYEAEESNMTAGKHLISIQSYELEEGIYFIQMNIDDQTSTAKIVVLK